MKEKTVFVCSECGYRAPQWTGKCRQCGKWNTMEEQEIVSETPAKKATRHSVSNIYDSEPTLLKELELPNYIRSKSGIGELDRVLGGGLVNGSAVLISGEPGIGKSTLLMQISGKLCPENKVLYVSGEESGSQLKLRAKRLGVSPDNLYILIETNIDKILSHVDKIKPDIIIVDSVQTIYDDRVSSSAGSITQVRETSARFIIKAKNEGISIILVSHVNKEGMIAGPKVLEHAVDAVLYFEGEKRNSYRIIRAIKNRFGSTNEIGVFEMNENGLEEVPNPSEALLAGRPKGVSGSCAVCLMEGSRPIIAEVQALGVQSVFPSPKRSSNGIDHNRMYMLLAVLEKRLGLRLSQSDLYLNVVGGLRIEEPAADMAVALALISSMKDKPVPENVIAIGEIGLAGECRAVPNIDQRICEAVRLGFDTIIIPKRNYTKKIDCENGIKIIPVSSIFSVLMPPNSLFD
ncbi:MAG: DNA repair protein RadA [Ruminococcaceae bacterium]|nr:DNA repair protein RadA [Oscillospiraceae bacterium]